MNAHSPSCGGSTATRTLVLATRTKRERGRSGEARALSGFARRAAVSHTLCSAMSESTPSRVLCALMAASQLGHCSCEALEQLLERRRSDETQRARDCTRKPPVGSRQAQRAGPFRTADRGSPETHSAAAELRTAAVNSGSRTMTGHQVGLSNQRPNQNLVRNLTVDQVSVTDAPESSSPRTSGRHCRGAE